MKNECLVKKNLFLLFFSHQPGVSGAASGENAAGRDLRQVLHLFVLAVVLFVSLPVPLWCAEESGALLENITFARESSTRETITFKLNGPQIPKIFAMKGEVPKVVFDFDNTRISSSIKGVMKSRGNLISAIRTAMHTDPQLKTRVVLDLVPAGDYDFAQEFKIKDNTLIITIFHAQQKKDKLQSEQKGIKSEKADVVPAGIPVKTTPSREAVKKETASLQQVKGKKFEPPSTAVPVVAVKKPSASSSQLLIQTISFEQSPDKGEKVLFKLTNFHPPVVFGVEEGTPTIVCDFIDSSLGDEVPEIIPAQGKFIRQVRVEKSTNSHKTRVVLELVPNRHYDLQQVFYKEENLYVIFVNSSDSVGSGGSGKP